MLCVLHLVSSLLLPVKECLGLLQDAEHLLATANSLLLKLDRGLELQCSTTVAQDSLACHKELEASIEILLTQPELVIKEPTCSRTGDALRGLLTAQGAMQVSVCKCEHMAMNRQRRYHNFA